MDLPEVAENAFWDFKIDFEDMGNNLGNAVVKNFPRSGPFYL